MQQGCCLPRNPKDQFGDLTAVPMKTNILVVDDEKDFADLLAERLELKGLTTAVAYDGIKALAWLDDSSCEIVLLDLSMPGMNGIDVLPRIKQDHPDVQVIILTAASDINIAIAGMKLGATDYLIKPVEFEALLAAIRDAQSRRIGQEESLRMIETSKMAAFGVLAEGVAHEIINPVNVMLSATGWVEDLLQDDVTLPVPDRDEMLSALGKIRQHGMRCKDIVAKLLAFGGRIDPTPKSVQLNDFLANLLEKNRERAGQLGVDIQVQFAADLPMLFIPPAQFTWETSGIIWDSRHEARKNAPPRNRSSHRAVPAEDPRR